MRSRRLCQNARTGPICTPKIQKERNRYDHEKQDPQAVEAGDRLHAGDFRRLPILHPRGQRSQHCRGNALQRAGKRRQRKCRRHRQQLLERKRHLRLCVAVRLQGELDFSVHLLAGKPHNFCADRNSQSKLRQRNGHADGQSGCRRCHAVYQSDLQVGHSPRRQLPGVDYHKQHANRYIQQHRLADDLRQNQFRLHCQIYRKHNRLNPVRQRYRQGGQSDQNAVCLPVALLSEHQSHL